MTPIRFQIIKQSEWAHAVMHIESCYQQGHYRHTVFISLVFFIFNNSYYWGFGKNLAKYILDFLHDD